MKTQKSHQKSSRQNSHEGKTIPTTTDFLVALANAVAAIEETQRRFRNAVFVRLSRIDTIVTMIHGAQIVEAHQSRPACEEKMSEHAKGAEEFIAQRSKELGIRMVTYLHGSSGETGSKQRRKRQAEETLPHDDTR